MQFDRAAKTGKVEISFDLGSVSTGVALLDKHLQSADFFDTAKYPNAKFVGDKFVFNGDKVTEVGGTLTLRGKTRAGDAEGQPASTATSTRCSSARSAAATSRPPSSAASGA